jgi:hypothetical protein
LKLSSWFSIDIYTKDLHKNQFFGSIPKIHLKSRKIIDITNYTLTAGFMEYFCYSCQDKTDLKLAIETGNWFYIMANAFGSFIKEDRNFRRVG